MGRARTRGVTPEEEAAKHPGVEIHGQAIRINFQYQRKRCRETLSIPVTAANIRLAANKRAAILHEISIGSFDYAAHFPNSPRARTESSSRRATLQEVHDRYVPIKAANITAATERRYRVALDVCCSEIGWGLMTDSIMPEDIDQLRAKLIGTRKPSTVNHYLACWNGLAAWALKNGYVTRDLGADFFKNTPDNPDPLSFEEYQAVIENGCLHPQDVALVTLAVYTGLRPGELCGLAREDVDGSQLHIRRSMTDGRVLKVPKTTKERTVWLVPPAQEAIRVLLELTADQEPQDEVVEISRHQSRTERITPLVTPVQARNKKTAGRRLVPLSWATKWGKLLSRAKVRFRTCYQTRHTYACWSLTAHGNIAFIANQMGHQDFSMLVKVYGRWMDSESKKESEFVWTQMRKAGAFAPTMPQKFE
ncbi:site-specific integrase [Marinobacter sp. CA1]|uniref:site-specific integrase n=1 Tax=Marinobacter sp. CA1 TaxID=2817656 RepID=UPI001D07536A|nr:site-specific integrase [Marinobacter sp. CA1]UDL04024.1 site-specific integrase [Marinobacter sp. CA1]